MKKPGTRLKHLGRQAKGWVKKNGKKHVIDCTSLLAATHPLYTAFEVNAGKLLDWIPFFEARDLSDELSISARIWISKWTYLGLGYLFAAGAAKSREQHNITDLSSERDQMKHDIKYTIAFNAAAGPFLYSIAGATADKAAEPRDIVAGTLIAMTLAIPTGPIMKYAIGAGRDLAGIETFERRTYPDLLRKRNGHLKKAIGVGLVGASVGLMSLIYSATDDSPAKNYEQQQTRQIVELNDVVD